MYSNEIHMYERYWQPELMNAAIYQHEYDEEWKEYLLKRNSEDANRFGRTGYRFAFYSPKLVAGVFNICKLLDQPPDVRYLAVDILDRFLIEHFFVVRDSFRTMHNVDSSDWKTIMDRLKNQLLLRILTCIQIAAKQCSICNMITARTIQKVMVYMKHPHPYSKKNVIKSEARICKTLNFQISSRTPLTYIEMVLDDLKKYEFFQRKRNALYELFGTSLQVLDVALIHHKKIYSNTSSYFKGDFMALAASVIFAASVLNGIGPALKQCLFEKPDSSWTDYHQKSRIIHLGKEILKVIN